jgi:DNA-binding winged helix-turn-helix (wHTH) protein
MTGPGGTADVEPRVMQVLVVLAEAGGQVVTRGTLFDRCWGGVFVGDDSLNRTIAAIRKLAADIAGGSFEIETIPRTGYRLNGEVQPLAAATANGSAAPSSRKLSRRALIGSAGGVAVAGAAGFGLWSKSSSDRRFEVLLRRGVDALEYGDGTPEPSRYLKQAVAMRPNDAAAQGLLAFSLASDADNGEAAGSQNAVNAASDAGNASLRLDPGEPNARLALIALEQSTLDLGATEDRLRRVLASAPDDIFAMRLLWSVLQCAGRSRDALALVQRAIAVKPLAASNNYPLAQLLWIVGRVPEADRVIDRAMSYWPDHRYVRFARFTIFAYTGRPRAALRMLDSDGTRPQGFSPAAVALYRTSLEALDQPSPANITKARAANREAAKDDPKLARQAVLSLCAMGDVDGAFEVANALLAFWLPHGANAAKTPTGSPAPSVGWRFTPWLFTPPAAPLRADLRFDALADGTGLTAYWTQRRIKPDYQLYG